MRKEEGKGGGVDVGVSRLGNAGQERRTPNAADSTAIPSTSYYWTNASSRGRLSCLLVCGKRTKHILGDWGCVLFPIRLPHAESGYSGYSNDTYTSLSGWQDSFARARVQVCPDHGCSLLFPSAIPSNNRNCHSAAMQRERARVQCVEARVSDLLCAVEAVEYRILLFVPQCHSAIV